MNALARATRLRYVAGQSRDRKVTWLELFFDLVFAAAVAQVASPLRDDYSADGLLRFAILFVLIWWAWIGHAVFSTRFDTDDAVLVVGREHAQRVREVVDVLRERGRDDVL